MRHADIAMYAAKEAGRGRYEVFHYDMAREFGEPLGLEQELRLGLQRGEFSMHYQPEISLDSSTIVGVEALVRWKSPTRGWCPPGDFIPLAETTGLILPLGEFVLRAACEQTALAARRPPPRPVRHLGQPVRQAASAGGISTLVRGRSRTRAYPPPCSASR